MLLSRSTKQPHERMVPQPCHQRNFSTKLVPLLVSNTIVIRQNLLIEAGSNASFSSIKYGTLQLCLKQRSASFSRTSLSIPTSRHQLRLLLSKRDSLPLSRRPQTTSSLHRKYRAGQVFTTPTNRIFLAWIPFLGAYKTIHAHHTN